MRSINIWLLSCLGSIGPRGFPVACARFACYNLLECEHKVRKGSDCVDGFCTNPYHVEGCLAHHLGDSVKVRTCNSDDPPSSMEKGYCRQSALDYKEVRIGSQNWESAFFTAWILQILLSELLDIPASLETGKADQKVDFYDINMSFDYGGLSNDWDGLRRAKEVKDCTKHKQSAEYLSCIHFIPGTSLLAEN